VKRLRVASGVAAVLMAATLIVGCGGGGSSSPSSPSSPAAPTTPTTPTTPSLNVCGILTGTPSFSHGIVTGTQCPTANTSVVLVNLRDKNGNAVGGCTGTVIARRAVLTAAHCLDGDAAIAKVYLGTGEQILAESFQWSPRYRAGDPSSLDVGVVITTQDLDRTPIALLTSRDARVGEQAVIAGWGRDENDNLATLRAGTAAISAVWSTLLETQYPGSASSVCFGDSGGPLLLSEGGVWAIGGIISATGPSGTCRSGPSYYANVRNADITKFILDLVPGAGQR